MSDNLYKAHRSYRLDDNARNTLKLRAMMAGGCTEGIIGECRDLVLQDARNSEVLEGRSHHLLNLYVSISEDFKVMDFTYVFDDRDTALMFKLATT